VLVAVVLAEPGGDLQADAGRASLLATPLALGDPAHRVRLEEGQDLVQPIELDGLVHEVGRAEPQALNSRA
jgi:hypothetical protein